MSTYASAFALCFALAVASAAAQSAAAPRLPVREVTVFKDGHAFVAHQGVLPTDTNGNVQMDYLPSPVIGTFWPYATGNNVKLTGVVAGRQLVKTERTALTIPELLEANVGATAEITDLHTNRYTATIIGFPTRTIQELQRTHSVTNEPLAVKGDVILLRTAEGVKAVHVGYIRDVTFKDFKATTGHEEYRSVLTLDLDWNGRRPAREAEVGLMYLQKGIRWIPSYKVTLDGNGKAVIRLQATIINEMTDLRDTDVNLVIGVPTFTFKETLDPLALQQTAAQLSQYFQNDPRADVRHGLLAANFSNAIMTQTARMGEYNANPEPGPLPGDTTDDDSRTEDLFVFKIKSLTLLKGERTAVHLAEYTIPYEDIFVLDLPFTPPPEVRANNSQQAELQRLFAAPKVMHKVRLQNKGPYPLTTAPALIMRGDAVVAQGMMTYTAAGASTDLALTTAVDVQVHRDEKEAGRKPNAFQDSSSSYTRIDMQGKISLVNHRKTAAKIEVNRYLLGTAEEANEKGKITRLNVFEDGAVTYPYPYWWHWYGWPSWWHHFNGSAQIAWTIDVPPGKTANLEYSWYYFWR